MKLFAGFIGLTAGSLCPSDYCWKVNEESKLCELKEDTTCFKVDCTTETMTVTMLHSLFGTEGNEDAFDEGGPVYDANAWAENIDGYVFQKALQDVDVAIIKAPTVADPNVEAEYVDF